MHMNLCWGPRIDYNFARLHIQWPPKWSNYVLYSTFSACSQQLLLSAYHICLYVRATISAEVPQVYSVHTGSVTSRWRYMSCNGSSKNVICSQNYSHTVYNLYGSDTSSYCKLLPMHNTTCRTINRCYKDLDNWSIGISCFSNRLLTFVQNVQTVVYCNWQISYCNHMWWTCKN